MNVKALFFNELWLALSENIDILVLRNYEGFPQNLGNDVDLLVMDSSILSVLEICENISLNSRFKIVKKIERNNNLMAVYFSNRSNSLDILKVDFFTELSKGWLSYASTKYVLNNKIKYGMYFVPDLTHEAYLLLMKELFMYGRLRSRYVVRFASKYKDINFEEIYNISDGLVAKPSILKIVTHYSDIGNIVLTPRPTIKNVMQLTTAISWLYYTIKYRFFKLLFFKK